MADRAFQTRIDDLVRALEAPLRRYFARQGYKSDVDDLVQEVFLRLSKLETLNGIENTKAYTFQIAANVLKDSGRRKQVRPQWSERPLSDVDEPADARDPERVLIGQDDLARVQLALLALPPRARTVFLLHRFDGLNYKEIAKVLGISVSGVEKHMMLALSRVLAAARSL